MPEGRSCRQNAPDRFEPSEPAGLAMSQVRPVEAERAATNLRARRAARRLKRHRADPVPE
jgi:hypothetical protein